MEAESEKCPINHTTATVYACVQSCFGNIDTSQYCLFFCPLNRTTEKNLHYHSESPSSKLNVSVVGPTLERDGITPFPVNQSNDN